eukprot:CAMPEP_0183716434 /NCGR_PEP_ID=MMETSP0737-20130205/10357_1 /TAXON_ID=385413 /ORGANISM="Thalassiosira miniscula, Strain CCMP1093" /LENGTH=380 /DNA_ID=CAMNT_0025945711 /DNA_START=220 /DNA_END=1363 /DNA_ORIENTATION=+
MMMQHQHHPTNPPKPVTGAKDTFARGADYFNCRLMPHGGAVLFPVLLSTLGLCATLVDDGCDYARLRGAGVILLAGSASVPYVDCGISAYRIPDFYPAEKKWRVHYTGECMPYEHMDILADTSWVASEWLRFFALVIGATTALFLWTSTCLTLRPKHWLAAGIGALLTCIFQTCSFVWFYTKLCHTSAADFEDFESGREVETNQQETDAIAPSSCELFFGSKCAVTSCVLWAAASLMILLRKYPNPVPRFIVAEEDDAALKATIAPLNPSGARLRDSVSGRSGAKDSFTTGRSSVSFSVRKPGRDKSNLRNSEALTASMSTTGSRQQTPRSMGRGGFAQVLVAQGEMTGRRSCQDQRFRRGQRFLGCHLYDVTLERRTRT